MATVKMKNEETGKEADVHPDMIEEYEKGGFRKVEKVAKVAKVSKRKAKV